MMRKHLGRVDRPRGSTSRALAVAEREEVEALPTSPATEDCPASSRRGVAAARAVSAEA